TPAFKSLHESVNQLANSIYVLFVNVVALGFSNLLKYDLLGGLGGDAAELLSGFGELELVAYLGALDAQAFNLDDIDLRGRIFYLLDDPHDRIELDIARFGIVAGVEILAGLELFAGRRNDCVFDGGYYDLLVDPLLTAQDLNRLRYRTG